MAAKLSLVLVAAFVIFQAFNLQTEAVVVRRQAPVEKNASQTIDEAIESFKSGLNDLLTKVQENELFQNMSTAFKQFGETVQQQGKQLAEKIQSDSKPKN